MQDYSTRLAKKMRTTFSRKTQGSLTVTCARNFLRAIVAICLVFLGAFAGTAQTRPQPTVGSVSPDPARNAEAKGETRRAAIRFVTDTDYPPFNYYDEDGTLTGYNVDLAKAICLELAAACDIQVRPWNELVAAVKRGDADAVIASHAVTPRVLQDVLASDRYYHTPARFVGLKSNATPEITPAGLEGRRIAVGRGTAHEAYLRTFFTLSNIQVFENADLARDAVRNRTADLLFDDGISLVFWLNGESSKLCCEFKGGPFIEPRFFGDGIGILLNREDPQLRTLVNAALKRVRESGRQEELMLRYFPLRPY
jgi:polar amino acid transport system substrate-binding protein